MRPRSIRYRLLLAVVVACIIPYGLSSYYISSLVSEQARNNFVGLSDEFTAKIQIIINQGLLGPAMDDINMLAADDRTRVLCKEVGGRVITGPGDIRPEQIRYLENFLQTHDDIMGVAIGTENGGYLKYPEYYNDLSFNPRVRPWYTVAESSPAKAVVTDPYARIDKEIVVAVSRMITEQGRPLGVMVTGWSLKRLQKEVESVRVGETGYVMVLNNNNKFVVSPKHQDWLLKTPQELGLTELDALLAKSGASAQITLDGAPRFLHVRISPETGWKVVSVIDEAELASNVRQILSALTPVYFMTMFAILAAVFLITRRLTDPLRDLSRGATALAGGDLNVQVNVSRDDELGVLANSFNTMAQQIKENFLKIQFQSDELRKREHEFKTIVENAPDIIIRTDRELRIVYVNPIFSVYTGKPINEYIGRARQELDTDSRHWDTLENVWRAAFDSAAEQWNEFEINDKDGQRQYFQVHSVPEFGSDGAVETVLSIVRDVTGQKIMERQLAHWDRLNLIGEMAAGIAHEVRNPLTTVRGFLQLLRRNKSCIDLQEQFQLMIDEIDRANAIITEYLALAKNKAINPQTVNLNDIIQSLSPLMRADAILTNKDIRLILGEIPETRLDEKELRQLILNLVRNSLEAMDHGGIVTISTYRKNDAIVLAVADQGNGIPEEVLERIGTPFVSTKSTGTGLGLAVCYSIAARHSASIDFDTSPEGTTFRVRFRPANQ